MRNALLAVVVGCSACHHSPPALAVVSATDLGAVGNSGVNGLLRDGGASILLGGQILWTFGDTLFPFKADDGSQLRTNTAALASPGAPLAVTGSLDSHGAPTQYVPFTSEEAAFNAASGNPNERIALWPGPMVAIDADHALVVVDKLKVHAGVLNYEALSTELVLATAGSATAQRLGPLFTAPEPQFVHAAVASSAKLYLYACQTSGQCSLARTPLATATQRATYQYWTGNGWSNDLGQARGSIPGSTSGFSVAWNEHLGQFVSASSPGFSSAVLLRTAPAPEGPWSDAVVAYTAPSPIYAVYQHPEQQQGGGARIRVSYSRPTGNFQGEIRLIELQLK